MLIYCDISKVPTSIFLHLCQYVNDIPHPYLQQAFKKCLVGRRQAEMCSPTQGRLATTTKLKFYMELPHKAIGGHLLLVACTGN